MRSFATLAVIATALLSVSAQAGKVDGMRRLQRRNSGHPSAPTKAEVAQAYGAVPVHYAPEYNPHAKEQCTYRKDGWLKCAKQHGCPIKVKHPKAGQSSYPPTHAGGGSTCGNGQSNGGASDSASGGAGVGGSGSGHGGVGGGLLGGGLGGGGLGGGLLGGISGQGTGGGGSSGGGSGSGHPSTGSGTTSCNVQGGGLINANVFSCSQLCILSNCPSQQQSCSVRSSSGSLLNVSALDCSSIKLLSS